MEDLKIEFGTYQGKKNIYEMINIFEENLNIKNSGELKTESMLYYENKNLNNLENVCVDLGKVKKIDSSGLSIILCLRKLGNAKNRKNFSIISNKNYVSRMLIRGGIDNYFKILKSRDEL